MSRESYSWHEGHLADHFPSFKESKDHYDHFSKSSLTSFDWNWDPPVVPGVYDHKVSRIEYVNVATTVYTLKKDSTLYEYLTKEGYLLFVHPSEKLLNRLCFSIRGTIAAEYPGRDYPAGFINLEREPHIELGLALQESSCHPDYLQEIVLKHMTTHRVIRRITRYTTKIE